jgi:hypothetical protein
VSIVTCSSYSIFCVPLALAQREPKIWSDGTVIKCQKVIFINFYIFRDFIYYLLLCRSEREFLNLLSAIF